MCNEHDPILVEKLELRRMLLWFKTTLPPHELGDWQIAACPEPEPTAVEGDLRYSVGIGARGSTQVRIRGHATCSRCRRTFKIPNSGDAVAFDESRVPAVVAKMKERVAHGAIREGPCWGDVPEARADNLVTFA